MVFINIIIFMDFTEMFMLCQHFFHKKLEKKNVFLFFLVFVNFWVAMAIVCFFLVAMALVSCFPEKKIHKKKIKKLFQHFFLR